AATDDVDGLSEAPVARRVDGLEIVERAQDVVVPPWRESGTSEYGLDDFAGTVGAKEPVYQEELTAAALRGSHRAHAASTVQLVEPQALEHADGGMKGSVRCALRTPAIPSTVGHLLLQKVVGNGVETVVVIFEVGEDGQHHPRDARLAPTR